MLFEQSLKGLRSVLSRLVESVWDCGFHVAGSLKRSTAQTWSSRGGERVLAISPHPDDEAIACSGTIVRHLKARDEVVVLIATDGRRSRQAAGPEQMAAIREQEARKAAETLGVERLVWLGLQEGSWRLPELSRPLTDLLRAYAPTIIYAPSRVDFHPEHVAVACALGLALESISADSAVKPRVRVYQVQVPLTRTLTNVIVDIDEGLASSNAALRAYASQAGSIEFLRRRRRYSTRSHGAAGVLEEFWELTADQYRMLHDESSIELAGRFRGLRRFAWTDPLAYFAGSGERRRLRSLVLDCARAAELGGR